jgi:hypothetical protein
VRLALPPAVWLTHFGAVYLFASVACERLVLWATHVTAAALALFATTGLLEYRRWRSLGGGPAAFVSLTNLLVCALAALAALWVAYPAFVLPPCNRL